MSLISIIFWLVMLPALAVRVLEEILKKRKYKTMCASVFDMWDYEKYVWLWPTNKWYRRRIMGYSLLIYIGFFTIIIISALE